MVKIDRTHTSPNFAAVEIPVDFLVLHYTACDLRQTLEIFGDRERQVCAHFVLDLDGTVYDLGNFYDGPILQGAHAGQSHLEIGSQKYAGFNKFSVGIEMINLNGNLIPYTDEQYESLTGLVRHLQGRFPALGNPDHIVGHEHIAHWRGKADPGVLFDWQRFLTSVQLAPSELHSFFACTDDLDWLKAQTKVEDWAKLNSEFEKRIAKRVTSPTKS